jgi:Bacterial Ig-like domain (group 3)/FG-GAP-like repeat
MKKICFLLSVVLTLVPAAAMAQTAVRRIALPVQRSAKASQPVKAHTPLERWFLPEIRKRIAARAAHATPAATPRAADTGVTTTAPNFGGYLTAPYYPTRTTASCVVDPYNCGVAAALTADYDKDGKPDVAVVQYDGTLNILLGNGVGGFAAPVPYSNPNVSSTEIAQAFAADVNNDGYPDIVAYDQGNNAILVWLNLRNGTFAAPVATAMTYNFGNVANIAVGDVNGDGNPDIVTVAVNNISVTDSAVTVQTWLGKGDGTFIAPGTAVTQTFTVAAQVEFSGNLAITLGDLNKDGKLDVAVEMEEYTSNNTGLIVATVALGNGDGSFAALNVNDPISAAFTGTGFFFVMSSAGVQIVDLNGDSNPDVAIDANSPGVGAYLEVALGDGKGGFSSTVQTQNVAAANQIVYADVNGDGIPDIVLDNGVLEIWSGKGDGTFTLQPAGNEYILDGGGGEGLALADFNGDGNVDVAELGGDYKQLSLFAGNGKGSFTGAPALSSTTDTDPAPLYIQLNDVADVQGKGFTSALYIDYSGTNPTVVTGVSDGKGNFTYVTGLSAAAVPTLAYLEPVQADFNGDGMQDLLIANEDGSMSYALSNGDGTFKAPVSLGLPTLDCVVDYGATGDLNGDGLTDIVVAYPGDSACGGSDGTPSGYFVVLGKAGGTFAAPVFTPYGSELYSVTIADMNMDGIPDLLLDDAPFQAGGTFAVDLLPGNGDGTFASGIAVKSNYLVSQVIAGDYNQDGKPDLVLFTEGEQTDQDFDTTAGILLMPGNGDGSFGATEQIGTGNFFLNGALVDVNGDGIPDLVAALYNTPAQPNTYYGLSTLLGEGGGSFADPVNVLESLDSELPFVGNFYSDNAPDFIVATAYGTALYLGQGGDTIALTGSGSSIAFGQAETLTATVTQAMANRPTPTGTISFYDGTTLLGSAALSSGAANLATSSLAVGTHSITAVYSGSSNFNPITSAAVGVTVTSVTPAFSLAASPTSMNVTQGQTGTATLTLTANSTFNGSVSLACSGAPTDASCAVSPASVTLAPGSQVTATLVLATTSARSAASEPATPWSKSSGVVTLAAVFWLFSGRRSRRKLLLMVSLAVLTLAGLAMSGCGGNSIPVAQKGSYTLTITATPSGGAGSPQTATVMVAIQ